MQPGIYHNISNADYHAGPGVSKSGLWKLYTQTPAHFRYGAHEHSAAFDMGEACHLAVLQPDEFERRVYRGPEDRRGNKWKDAADWAAANDRLILTAGDYDAALAIRDALHADQWIHAIITGGKPIVEASGYWIDEQTGELCRCRPDLYREDLGVIIDLKSTASAHPEQFARSVVSYGYHAQEAFYSDGWAALGKPVNAFAFIAFEKKPPYAFAVYELPPAIVEDGRAIMRKALDTYAECKRSDKWPGYPAGVRELSFSRWAYSETEAPTTEAA